MQDSLNSKVKSATKWATIGEVSAKLVTPITSMVLARLLTPEAFGVVTTLTMIISFAEIFADAGFQKYLVQHEYKDAADRDESINVAFWSNLVLSLLLWGIIALFNEQLASVVGNPGLGHVLIIACVSIPLTAFSSIQAALFRRDLDFKTLAKVRIIATLVPLFVTVPLALWMRSYWALIIGTITVNTVNAVLLTAYSWWKPRFYYRFDKFKEMFSFTVWSLLEAVSIWLTGYVDVFIVGTMLSQYYLGLYKTSSTLVGQIMGLITSVTTPILFSALSRLQNDEDEFRRLFFRFQKLVGLLVLPLGMGIFLFSDLATDVLLGEQWSEASGFVGLWGLTYAISIVLSHYSSEVYRAKGKPKLSVLAQLLHFVVLLPSILISAQYSFEVLYITRSLVRLEMIVVNLAIMWFALRMPIGRMFTNIIPSCLATSSMMLVWVLPQASSIWQSILYIIISVILYLVTISFFNDEKMVLLKLPSLLLNNKN